jgi:hypothetical protein
VLPNEFPPSKFPLSRRHGGWDWAAFSPLPTLLPFLIVVSILV